MSEPAPWPPWPRLWLPAAALALLFAWRASELSLVVDDAYIGFRYAENLAEHGELVYNLGERVEGYTNPLWTAGLAVLAWLGATTRITAVVGGALAALAALWLVLLSGRRLGAPPLAAFSAALLVATNRSFAFWSVAGLESALFALLLLAAWYRLEARSATEVRGALSFALLAALAGLTRTEAMVLALLAPALLAWRGARGRALVASLAGPAVALAHLAWRQSYYSSWLPNPVLAKVELGAASVARGASYVAHGLWEEGGLLCLPLIVLSLAERRSRGLVALVALYTAFIVAAGGDGLYGYRFLAHVTPAAAVLVATGLGWLARRSILATLATGALALLGAALQLGRADFFRGATLTEVREWEERFTLVGAALGRAAPKQALLATNVAGRVPYAARLRTLDLLGLTDPVIARTPVPDMGAGYAGHERAAPAYVLARKPDVIYLSVIDGLPEPLFIDSRALRHVLASGSLRRYAALFDHPGFTDAYRPAFLRLDDGRFAGLLVRGEGKSGALVLREWKR